MKYEYPKYKPVTTWQMVVGMILGAILILPVLWNIFEVIPITLHILGIVEYY